MSHVCFVSSFEREIPRSFALKPADESLLTAVITKMRLSQTTGLAWERPGMDVFQSMFDDFSTSHVEGSFVSRTPEVFGPRNAGQFCALIVSGQRKKTRNSSCLMRSLYRGPRSRRPRSFPVTTSTWSLLHFFGVE